MSNREIVEEIARKGWVEECIRVVTGGIWRPEHKDLTQDILMELLDLPSCKLKGLYKRKQLKFYIMRIVRNNIQSKTSRFYYRYRRFSLLNSGPECSAFLTAVVEEDE